MPCAVPYMGNIWRGGNLANREQFASPIFTDTLKMYALTVAYSPNFSSPIAFTCTVHQNFLPPNNSHVQ